MIETEDKSVITIFLTYNIIEKKWVKNEAKENLINETMLSFRKYIVLRATKRNPLIKWKDAIWHKIIYQPLSTSCLITWTPFIPCDEQIFTIKNGSK
jgi:hypothetical protein